MTENNEKFLNPSEKLRFQEIMVKLLSQRIPLSILSNSEKQDLANLLDKLGININLFEYNTYNEINDSSTLDLSSRNLLFSHIITSIPYIIIFLATVTIPALIAFTITNSQLLASLIVIGLTFVLIFGTGALMGKVSWGMTLFTTTIIAFTVLAFYFLLK